MTSIKKRGEIDRLFLGHIANLVSVASSDFYSVSAISIPAVADKINGTTRGRVSIDN